MHRLAWGAGRKDNQVLAYITNHSKENLELRANVLIATWEADIDEDIATGDRLVRHAEEARGSPKAMSILTLTEAGDDWEWADEHLYLDVSRTPVGEPDPPVEATLETLKEALREKIQQLGDRLLHGDNTPDACEERRRDLDQLKRINARIKQHSNDIVPVSTELPPDLQLVQGYEHLTSKQRKKLKDMICSEGPFFMKGKYPTVIRTDNPVSIDVGQAKPRVSGYRHLNPEEQRVNEYVEKLIAADVVEPCNGPWSSPILLPPSYPMTQKGYLFLSKPAFSWVTRKPYHPESSQDRLNLV